MYMCIKTAGDGHTLSLPLHSNGVWEEFIE